MWEEILQFGLTILRYIIFVLIGIISIFLYRQTKKRGFVLIGSSFLLEAISAVVVVFVQAFSNLLLAIFTDELILAILVLIGAILLRSEFKSKPAP